MSIFEHEWFLSIDEIAGRANGIFQDNTDVDSIVKLIRRRITIIEERNLVVLAPIK